MLNCSGLLLAAIEDPKLDPKLPIAERGTNNAFGWALQDILLLGGVLAVLALLLFLWVYLTRKNRRRKYAEGGARVIYEMEEKDVEHSEHRRRRRRRPDHPDNLPRNPTLAEAGGLPPIRPDEPSDAAH